MSDIDKAVHDAGAALQEEKNTAQVGKTVGDVEDAIKSPSIGSAVNIPGVVKELIAQPAFGSLVRDVPGVVKETKAGYKTTEFWVALATVLATQLGALHLPGHYGATIATVAAILGYILSRGVAKAGVPNVVPDPAAVAPAEEIVQREEGALT